MVDAVGGIGIQSLLLTPTLRVVPQPRKRLSTQVFVGKRYMDGMDTMEKP
jgi:hypothetical protein